MDRVFIKEDYDLMIAIKQGKSNRLTNFQKYWKSVCGNNEYLNEYNTNIVLKTFAFDNFNKTDWRCLLDYLTESIIDNMGTDLKDMNNCILRTIDMMKVRD